MYLTSRLTTFIKKSAPKMCFNIFVMSQVFQYMIMMDRKIHLKNLKLQPKCATYYIRHATIHRSACTSFTC